MEFSISGMLFASYIVYTSLCDLRPSYYHVCIHIQGVCLTVTRGECISSRASGTPVTTSPAGE